MAFWNGQVRGETRAPEYYNSTSGDFLERAMSGGNGIRRVTEADAERASALIAATTRESNARDYSPETIETVVADSNPEKMRQLFAKGTFFVAEADGALVGLVGLVDDTLRRLFVLPDHQGRGIGRTLLAAAEAAALEGGHDMMRVHSSLTATGFYEKLGFVVEGEETPKGIHVVKMSKLLADPDR